MLMAESSLDLHGHEWSGARYQTSTRWRCCGPTGGRLPVLLGSLASCSRKRAKVRRLA